MAFRCSIGVVTYVGRYESFFKLLVRRLAFLFPDYDINVFINGHYDVVKQVKYLREVTSFLSKFPAIRYVTNVTHQPIARAWNWLIMMAKMEKVLILNDDLSFNWEFRHNLERLRDVPDAFIINGSWSNFVISKSIVRKVGWFDERFLGMGDEDVDYTCRLALKGIPLGEVSIQGLSHHFVPELDPQCGWRPISSVTMGKYAQINREFLMKKWYHSTCELVPEKGRFRVKLRNEEWDVALKEPPDAMPEFYPMDCLDASDFPGGVTCWSKGLLPEVVSFADSCSRFAARRTRRLLSRLKSIFLRPAPQI